MDNTLTKRPEGVVLNDLSSAVFDTLSRFTAFPWPIMLAQCKRVGANPAQLTAAELTNALPFILTGVARFTDPTRAAEAERALTALLKGRP